MSVSHREIVPLIPEMRGFARSLAGGDPHLADDLVQDTIVLALRGWRQFMPGTNLKSWLLKILHNRFRSLRRRKYLTAEVASDDLAMLSSTPANQESRLELAAFKQAFKALKPEHREVLVLVAVHGLPYDKVAEICDCEVGTVKSRVSRARRMLKKALLAEPLPAPATRAHAKAPVAPARPPPAVTTLAPPSAAPVVTTAPPPAPVPVMRAITSLQIEEAERLIIRAELQLTRYQQVAAHLARAGTNLAAGWLLLELAEQHLALLHAHRERLLNPAPGLSLP
jgi:RNA polymerase sigma-70 factor (ECF subfamily)